MRRNIWKEPSAELQKRLSSPGCLAYKCCRDEHDDWWEERCNQGKISDAEHEQSWKKIDAVYESLSDDDKATLDDQCDIDSLNDDVSSYLWDAARHVELEENVWSVDTEQQYIGEMQQAQYVYPEYGVLVGPPSEKDFVDYGKDMGPRGWWIEDERKADLLLLGVFEWKGLYIARAHCQTDKDPSGWLVCTDPDYVPKDVLGAKSIGPYRYQLAFDVRFAERDTHAHQDVLQVADARESYPLQPG